MAVISAVQVLTHLDPIQSSQVVTFLSLVLDIENLREAEFELGILGPTVHALTFHPPLPLHASVLPFQASLALPAQRRLGAGGCPQESGWSSLVFGNEIP